MVHLADELLDERILGTHKFFERHYRLVVTLDIEVVAYGLARRREAVQQQRAGFAQRQRVALNSVGVVILLQPKLLQHPRLLLES